MRTVVLLVVCFLFANPLLAQRIPSSLSSQQKYRAIIFIGLECPISQKYMKKIEDLKQRYLGKAEFFAVVPERVSLEKIEVYKNEYNSSLNFISDADLQIATMLDAKITPEVFLLDSDDNVLYRGAIDNWFYALGKYRRTTTAHYLIDAIDAVLAGNRIKVLKTEAIGCFIEASPQHQHQHH